MRHAREEHVGAGRKASRAAADGVGRGGHCGVVGIDLGYEEAEAACFADHHDLAYLGF